jgi:hypothetical protein
MESRRARKGDCSATARRSWKVGPLCAPDSPAIVIHQRLQVALDD